MKDLISTVSKIANKKVNKYEAMEFAYKNFGELASFIRGELINELTKKREIKICKRLGQPTNKTHNRSKK